MNISFFVCGLYFSIYAVYQGKIDMQPHSIEKTSHLNKDKEVKHS